MKAMKTSGLSRVFNLRRKNGTSEHQSPPIDIPTGSRNYPSGSPEAAAIEALSKFCTTDPARTENDIDPAVYLPSVVESCESSPTACAEVAHLLGQFIGKTFAAQEEIQYKAVMVLRILVDNPGVTFFVRNLDKSFAANAKTLLRGTKNPNARILLIETLEKLDSLFPRQGTEVPAGVAMWRREKEKDSAGALYGYAIQPQFVQQPSVYGQQPPPIPTATAPRRNDYFYRDHTARHLPDPVELAARLEEAQNSAKLLTQCVTNAEASELLTSDLVKEFASRCKSATKSVQTYMNAQDPAPDNATMESLLDTNEQLQSALSTHQRAVLSARKALGIDSQPSPVDPNGPGFSVPPQDATAPISPLSNDAPARGLQLDTTNVPATPTPRRKGKERQHDDDDDDDDDAVSAISIEGDNPFTDPAPRASGSGESSRVKGKGKKPEFLVDDSDDDLYDVTPQRRRHH